MTCKRIIRPAAQADIDEQADYLALYASEDVAYRFLAAVDETVASLLKMPGIGSSWISEHPRLQDIRKHQVAGFPNHLLFYRHDEEAVEVLHLYHGKEDIEARLAQDADKTDDEPEHTP